MSKFFFTGIARITLQHEPGQKTSQAHSTDIRLEVSNNLDNRVYLDKGLPTKDGTKALTTAFIGGLIGNIHAASKNGWWDKDEHMAYIMKHLNGGISAIPGTIEAGDLAQNPLDPEDTKDPRHIGQIPITTNEGKLLFAALAMLSSESRTTQTPDEILADVVALSKKIGLDEVRGEG